MSVPLNQGDLTQPPNNNKLIFAAGVAFLIVIIIVVVIVINMDSTSTAGVQTTSIDIATQDNSKPIQTDTGTENTRTSREATATQDNSKPIQTDTGIVGPCDGFVPGSLTAACYQNIWNAAGCTTKLSDTTNPSLSGLVTWANSNKLSLDALKDDAKAWATLNDSAHILGCYVTKSVPNNIRMYGWAIGGGNQEFVPNYMYKKGDSTIYLLHESPYIKMVDNTGAARHYKGTIDDFNPSNWSKYNDSTGGYLIKKI